MATRIEINISATAYGRGIVYFKKQKKNKLKFVIAKCKILKIISQQQKTSEFYSIKMKNLDLLNDPISLVFLYAIS